MTIVRNGRLRRRRCKSSLSPRRHSTRWDPRIGYHTVLAAQDSIGTGGTLDGNLWLVGSGDPSLQSDDLKSGVGMLRRAGLRRIDGGVVVDTTTLGGPSLNPHWASDDVGQDYAAPTSAISLDGDTIESHQQVGGVDQQVWTPMTDVAKYVAGDLGHMLAQREIASAVAPAVGSAPLESVVLWDHRSAPLAALENHMLVFSDNHYAEQLLRTVGEETLGRPDDAGGLEAEREFLARRGIPAPGLKLFDGSGLAPDNRIAAITLARLARRRSSPSSIRSCRSVAGKERSKITISRPRSVAFARRAVTCRGVPRSPDTYDDAARTRRIRILDRRIARRSRCGDRSRRRSAGACC